MEPMSPSVGTAQDQRQVTMKIDCEAVSGLRVGREDDPLHQGPDRLGRLGGQLRLVEGRLQLADPHGIQGGGVRVQGDVRGHDFRVRSGAHVGSSPRGRVDARGGVVAFLCIVHYAGRRVDPL